MRGAAAVSGARTAVASVLVLSVVLTTGCGVSSDTQDLTQALRETRTAVRSAALAVDLLERGRTTRAAAQVTAGDMVDQIGLAQRLLVDAPGDTVELRRLRHRCQVVVTDSLVAVQNTEDALADDPGGAPAGVELPRVQRAVDTALAELGER